jgi:hypothetical protein
LDPNLKKTILPLSEPLDQLLQLDQRVKSGRPDTQFLTGLVSEYQPMFEDYFYQFCQQQAAEHDIKTAEEYACLTQTELLILLGDNYDPNDFDFDDEKGDGTSKPSREDKIEFNLLIYDWSIGRNGDKFIGFFTHLIEYSRKDKFPFLDKDLMFCVDVVRLKEINGDDVIKQKAQVMLDIYLDSNILPSNQIDVPSETHQKLLKAAVRISQGQFTNSEVHPFEETKVTLVKELLEYWAGYKLTINAKSEAPITKQQKLFKQRLDEFLKAKNPSPNTFKLPLLDSRFLQQSSPINNNNNRLGSAQQHQQKAHHPASLNIVFSIATGIKFKDPNEITNVPPQPQLPNMNENKTNKSPIIN